MSLHDSLITPPIKPCGPTRRLILSTRRFGFILLCLIVAATIPWRAAHAQGTEYDIIRLDDGSLIKGRIVAVDENIYRVETPSLGVIPISRDRVVAITKDAPSPAPATSSNGLSLNQQLSRDPALAQKMMTTQNRILSDPVLMESLVTLTQDPEMAALLSDPSLLTDLMNTPTDQWADHPKLKKLINHPALKRVIETIQNEP